MRFQVPQFIEIEDKIFGPLTFKQFVYVTGGGGMIVLFFIFLPFLLAVFFAIPVGALAGALAFYQINKRPFIITMEAAVKHFFKNKLYVWKKEASQGYLSESAFSSQGRSTESLKDKTFMLSLEKELPGKEKTSEHKDLDHANEGPINKGVE